MSKIETGPGKLLNISSKKFPTDRPRISRSVNIGLIGCGYWGPNYMRVADANQNCSLKYCCDLKKEELQKMQKKTSHMKVTQNYNDILNDPDIDAVIVATPTRTHYKIAKDCLLAKKHLLVEKPLAYTTKEAEELKDLAKKNNLKLMVGHIFLFNPSVNFIKELIDRNELGNIRYLHFQRRNLGPIRQDINVLWDLAAHDISMLLYFLSQKPLSVTAAGSVFLQKNIYDVVLMTIKFENNILAGLYLSWLDPIKIRDITIVGEDKMVFFDDVAINEKIKIFDKGIEMAKISDVPFNEYQIMLRSGDVHIPAVKSGEPLQIEFEHFINSLVSDTPIRTDGENGLQVVKILEAAQKSLDNNSMLVKI